ncbi:SHOCT domain-containing protein [Virgibacillus halophilus]|uniref:SHOCT domain-containing protein n=1 Tax=Tigheibacillus halophilus TaxID=361280 RepID=A0ABU5C9E4_9BACI|nr:SHOCT domain-containing protein [Virgibacillus halophilus]
MDFFITNVILWRKRGLCYYNRSDALSILESRLAKGEITGEEFNEIKKTLKGKNK